MKLENILTSLNNELEQYKGRKIDVAKFHKEIREVVKKVLEELQVKDLYYITWNIQNSEHIEYFHLNLEIEEDKRCKHERKGKVTKIEFELNNYEQFKNYTLDEYTAELKRQIKKQWLQQIEESIKEKEKELKEQKEKLEKELN